MLEFIQTLSYSYQRVLKLNPHHPQIAKLYPQRVHQLVFAEALLRKQELVQQHPDLPVQIAVIGPTQAGKSSLVNVLLNSHTAEVSPLAGFTVHPQGFCHEIKINQCDGLQQYFGRFQQVLIKHLSRERYDCYALTEIASTASVLPACVLWDTPDFDSIDAAEYKEGVLRTIALADVIILVVSKEKYADQSVWDMMSAIAPLKQPTLICINKLAEGTETLITASLQQKWQQARADAFPAVVPLFYHKPATELLWPNLYRNQLISLVTQGRQHQPVKTQMAYLQYFWEHWLEPIRVEHLAALEWQTLCSQELERTLQHYQRDYLNHPHHYATFQNALVELLELLEIPGVAAVLMHTRKILVWPVKQLLKFAQKSHHPVDSSHEVQLLAQLAEHLLIQLADQVLDKTSKNALPDWWKELAHELRRQRPQILQQFQLQASHYHEHFKCQVVATAEQLYLKLQELPMLLNSLRATRVTADAAAIAFTIKTGGIGAHDLLIAPAMLALTSMLTESALGSYLQRVQTELKQQQLAAVTALLHQSLQSQLTQLTTQLSAQQLFQISPEQVKRAEQYFTEKRHGLRTL